MCESFENDTVRHLVARCNHFQDWRAKLLSELDNACCGEEHLWTREHWLEGVLCGGCDVGEGVIIAAAICTLVIEVKGVKASL